MVLLLRGKLILLMLMLLSGIPCLAQDWHQSFIESEKTVLQTQWNEKKAHPFIQQQARADDQSKSVFGAFILSLAVPGLGEAYVGESHYTRIFLATEILGWGLYMANIIQVDNREEQYKNFAAQHAGIDRTGKDIQFWIDLGKYDSIYDHNEQRRRQRDVDAIYAETTQNFWAWDSEANRRFYEFRRIRAREIERNNVFYIGGIVLNHVVSAINALRLARAYNREQQELSWQMDFNFQPRRGEMSLSLSKSF